MTTSTTRMLRFLTEIFLVWSVATSDGASVGVVRLDGEAAPELEQHSDTDNADSLSFLTQYGYLPSSESGKSFLLTPDGLSSALKQMQKFGGLEQTGVLDEATLKLIKTPRCGVPDLIDGLAEDEDALDSLTIVDVVEEEEEEDEVDEENEENEGYYPSKRRRKRYALQGSRWKKRMLTYKVGKYPSKLSRAEVDADVGKAFNMWAKASGLTFSRKYSGSVDIEIRFENYYHGDEDSFDGPGGRNILIMTFNVNTIIRNGGSRLFPRVWRRRPF